MSNVHYDLFCLAELPTDEADPRRVNQLDRQLLGHICTRFNENETPPKAWPGEAELVRITGVAPESVSRSVTRLVRREYLFRITRPSKGTGSKRGNRSEVAPNMELIASYVHLTDELSIKNEKVLALYRKLTPERLADNPTEAISNPTDAITYPVGYAKRIEPINLIKRIDTKRWLIIVSKIPTEYRTYINPGQNYETLLDQCNANGHTNEDIASAIGRINFHGAYKKGGLLNDVLQGLAGIKRASKSKSRLEHCGNSFCDPVTRTFPEASEVNGRMDHRCNKCNEELVEETKRLHSRTSFDLGDFGKFGSLPDDV